MSDSHDRPPNSRSEAPVPPPAMPRSRRSAYLWILGLTVAWAFYLILWGPKPGDPGDLGKPDLRPPLLSITTDYDWDLVELDGSPVRLSNYRGRPLFLNLWATWCGPMHPGTARDREPRREIPGWRAWRLSASLSTTRNRSGRSWPASISTCRS